MTIRIFFVLAAALCGCASSASPQAISGALGAWEDAPVRVEAVDEAGSVLAEAFIEDSRFELVLPTASEYEIDLVREDGSRVPVVHERGEGLAALQVRVSGGTEVFDLGTLQYASPYISSAETILSIPGSEAGEGSGSDSEESGAAASGSESSEASEVPAAPDVCESDAAEDGESINLAEAAVPEHAIPSGLGVCEHEPRERRCNGGEHGRHDRRGRRRHRH